MSLLLHIKEKLGAAPPAAQATFWITIAGILFTLVMTAVRKVSSDIHVFETVMFRSVFGIAFMLPWLVQSRFKGLKTKRLGLLSIRGSLAYFVTFFYFAAAALIPLADLTSITFTRPILGTIAAILFLHEVARARRWTAIGVGFLGMLIIVRPGFVEVNLGVLLVFAGVVLQTCNTIIVKTLTRTEDPDTIALYHTTFIFPLSVVPAIVFWQAPNLEQVIWLIIVGGGGVLSQRCMTRAFVVADASFVLALSYIRLPIAAFVGFIFFGEVSEIWVWVGGSIICASAAYIAHRESIQVRRDINP